MKFYTRPEVLLKKKGDLQGLVGGSEEEKIAKNYFCKGVGDDFFPITSYNFSNITLILLLYKRKQGLNSQQNKNKKTK